MIICLSNGRWIDTNWIAEISDKSCHGIPWISFSFGFLGWSCEVTDQDIKRVRKAMRLPGSHPWSGEVGGGEIKCWMIM